MNAAIEQIIKKTVKSTVFELRSAGLLNDKITSSYQKTEELLRNYNVLSMSSDPAASMIIDRIENALSYIKEDPYYEIITLYYIGGRTREELADRFDTTVTTISRNKSRLVNKLKVVLFTHDYIKEIYGEDK